MAAAHRLGHRSHVPYSQPVSITDDLVANNAAYATSFDKGGLGGAPAKKVAILACMDARLDVGRMLGLAEGDAHVIRNAGGVATDDAIRSLVISQRLLGTEEIMVIHHTRCGMESFRDDDLKDQIQAETGIRPPFAMEAFPHADADVKQTAARLAACPFLPHKRIRGFVYEVESGRLREIPL
jgi:carbonic anhydrase